MIANNMINKFLLIIMISFFSGCAFNSAYSDLPMQTVKYVDIQKFMGDWYVIANIPTLIEKRATNAIESYRLNSDGEIETTFSFYQDSPKGDLKIYKPKGFIYNNETNAEWRMQFLWPFKLPFLIIDLAEDYRYTVIGYPSREYVWIMSREPNISNEDYLNITENLVSLGYDIKKIKKVIQKWD